MIVTKTERGSVASEPQMVNRNKINRCHNSVAIASRQQRGVTMAKNQHVTKQPDGMWQVKSEGAERAYRVAPTQSQAIDIARSVSRNQKSELYIHRPNGRIRARDSYGNDPYPPRG